VSIQILDVDEFDSRGEDGQNTRLSQRRAGANLREEAAITMARDPARRMKSGRVGTGNAGNLAD
jgi:hypothetical protein